jgi:methylglyoxal reductase
VSTFKVVVILPRKCFGENLPTRCSMRYRVLGRSEIKASVVGLGTWAISGWMWGGTNEANSIKAILASMDAGINLIDTAPVYGLGLAERIVAKAIRGRRDKVVLATKCGLVWHTVEGSYHGSEDGRPIYRLLRPESIRYELEESLKRLATDYIDLYQTHWQDQNTPIEDTMGMLLQLKQEGKIRAIGVSNASPVQLNNYHTLGVVDSDQEEYHMLNRDLEIDHLPFCRENDLAVLAYSPLAQGLLTGKISLDRQFPEGDFRRDYSRFSRENRRKVAAMLESIQPIACDHAVPLSHLAIAWTISTGRATHALAGARDPEQAKENAGAADVELDESELSFIDRQITQYASDIPRLW